MRNLSATESVILSKPMSARSVFAKVEVHDGGSTWYDLTNHLSHDWVKSVEYGDSVDAIMADATVVLQLRQFDNNLSPWMNTSLTYAITGALLIPGAQIRIYTATMPLGAKPMVSTDYNLVFDGYIEGLRVDPRGSIELRCLDKMIVVAKAWLEAPYTLADSEAETNKLAETFIQTLLTHAGPSGQQWMSPAVTLNSVNGNGNFNAGDSPSVYMRTKSNDGSHNALILEPQNLATLFKSIADQFGWCFKCKWQVASSAFQVMLFDPGRTGFGVAHTFQAADMLRYACELSRENIRNAVQIGYHAAAGQREYVTVTDSASITTYGRQFMRYAETSTESVIDSEAEATTMAENILSDAADPIMDADLEVPYIWPLEVNDSVCFPADNLIFNTTQQAAIKSIRHEIKPGHAVTKLKLSGIPKSRSPASWKSWLDFDFRKKVGTFGLTLGFSNRPNLLINGDFGARTLR